MTYFQRKNLEKSRYLKDAQLLKLINLADNKDFLDGDKAPTRTDYVEKREIDRSTLYFMLALEI